MVFSDLQKKSHDPLVYLCLSYVIKTEKKQRIFCDKFYSNKMADLLQFLMDSKLLISEQFHKSQVQNFAHDEALLAH